MIVTHLTDTTPQHRAKVLQSQLQWSSPISLTPHHNTSWPTESATVIVTHLTETTPQHIMAYRVSYSDRHPSHWNHTTTHHGLQSQLQWSSPISLKPHHNTSWPTESATVIVTHLTETTPQHRAKAPLSQPQLQELSPISLTEVSCVPHHNTEPWPQWVSYSTSMAWEDGEKAQRRMTHKKSPSVLGTFLLDSDSVP